MTPSEILFRADRAERLEPPPAVRTPAARLASLLGAGLLHGAILSALLIGAWGAAAVAPETTVTPVEIIVEPPQKSIDIAPAFDAPRAANKETQQRDAPDEVSKAASTPTPASPPQQPTPGVARAEATGTPQQGERQAPQEAAAPPPDKAEAEVERPAQADRPADAQQQARADQPTPPEQQLTFGGDPFPPWSIGRPSTFQALPGMQVAGAAQDTPIAGGKAKATYLSIVYGLVMSHMRALHFSPASVAKLEGVVVFVVDGKGALVERRLARASGLREFDSAALEAVVAAAPYPAPPGGLPMGLRFTYGANEN
jgi:protein TonB